ncbi:MAG: hypothetical protein IH900_00335 [Proteobacteria bacterium]|nr:hypothetical protein [Pseudomonadota bacterium]
MDFIFMLTLGDRTVENCLEVFDSISDTGLEHVGFKDIGVDRATLAELQGRIKATGAVSYMEVVSTTTEACLDSARIALDLGVDRLLGGFEVAATMALLAGSGIAYYPFPGRPEGHPTRLHGSPAEVAADCARMEQAGCAGADLLAYRAVDAEPLALVEAARAALSGALIVAGSIDTPDQIQALAAVGVDAFTIGTAAFEGSFSPGKEGLRAQIEDILAAAA